MKILYVTTIGTTMGFFKSFIWELVKEGHIVDIATNETNSKVPDCYRELGCSIYQISTSRSPMNKGNFYAIKQLKQLVAENKYDIVHCHTPIAAMCTRLACKDLRKNGVRIIYTAHGFHFYKGAPKKNWLMYYPVEKMCAKYTDTLITINKEDYEFAKKKMKAKEVVYVPGVGIDIDKFASAIIDRDMKRETLNIPKDATLLLSVGELNTNKNHEVVIRALAELKNEKIHYAIAGKGDLKEYLEKLAKELGVGEQIHLLGYRTDVVELYKSADVYVLPSIREGLNVSVIEAMASGLPVVCGKIRGNIDLIDKDGGALFVPYSVDECRKALEDVLNQNHIQLGRSNLEKSKKLSAEIINTEMLKIYK